MSDQSDCSGQLSVISAVILGILNGVSGLATITGNLMVLVTFFKNQSLHQPCYFLMASLSAIDLIVGVVVNPLYIVLTNFVSWEYRDDHLLQLESFFASSSSMIIMHNLSIMSIERYIAVNYPLRYLGVVTVKRTFITIVATWAFGVIFNGLYFATSKEDLSKMWIACSIVTGLIPMTTVSFCYAKIWQAARAQSRRTAVMAKSVSVPPKEQGSAAEETTASVMSVQAIVQAKRSRKAAWSVAIIVLVAVVLSMPVTIIGVLQIATTDLCARRLLNKAWMWVITLSLTSSAMDPWIYAMRIREFQTCVKQTLCIKFNLV